MKTARSHDSLYLTENRKHEPKEYFKFIVKEVSPLMDKIKNPSILDIGCATGDFLFYLSGLYPNAKLYGIDGLSSLIKMAKVEVPAANFAVGDIHTGKGLPDKKFDFVFMFGVLSIFDDYSCSLDNFIKLIRSSGIGYIFGTFNPVDVDVLVKARYSGQTGPWESGWNLFSKKSIGNYLKMRNIPYRFIDWQIHIDISENIKDPLRAWTMQLSDGRRLLVNGTQVLHHFSFLEIRP